MAKWQRGRLQSGHSRVRTPPAPPVPPGNAQPALAQALALSKAFDASTSIEAVVEMLNSIEHRGEDEK